MTRSDLQLLADMRVADAVTLLNAGRWAGAYYLLGYAVECALKACISQQFHEHEVPERTLVNDFYSHRLEKLLSISDAEVGLKTRIAADPQFQKNWNTVRDCTEASRYDHSITETEARAMLFAVSDQSSGVFPWLKTQW